MTRAAWIDSHVRQAAWLLTYSERDGKPAAKVQRAFLGRALTRDSVERQGLSTALKLLWDAPPCT